MGYESRIIVVDRKEHERADGEKWVYGDEIARFDLCQIGYGRYNGVLFPGLFTVPIDFDLNETCSEEPVPIGFYRKDCYGDHCYYTTDIDLVIRWLERFEEEEHYRRPALFLDFLRCLKEHKHEFRDLCLVHYGY